MNQAKKPAMSDRQSIFGYEAPKARLAFGQFIRICSQHLREAPNFLPILITQLSVKTDQSALEIRQDEPFKLSCRDAYTLVIGAIQHAYYTIKCIAESTLSGRETAFVPEGD